jgi:hypothetical protein
MRANPSQTYAHIAFEYVILSALMLEKHQGAFACLER